MEIFDIFLTFLLLYGTYLALPIILIATIVGLIFGVLSLWLYLEDVMQRGK